MNYITVPEQQVPVIAETDVLVIGSGPAGMGAALKAARCGAKTLLVEQGGSPGGISTIGMMSHWTGSSHSNIYNEILSECNERKPFPSLGWKQAIDPEILKCVYTEKLLEAGVEMLFYTFACGAVTENGKVKGVLVQNKSGRGFISAKVTVDASGDGDIAASAGVPFEKGRVSDGKMQPATLMFKVGGVDIEHAVFLGSFESTYETPKGELQALARQKLKAPAGHVLLYRSTLPGVVTCNMTNCIDVDGTDAKDLTKAEVTCRLQIPSIVAFLREYVPGYENCYLLSSASLIGVRETRRFRGVKTLHKEDILNAVQYDDWAVRDAHFNLDVHNITGPGLDKTGVQKYFTQENGYTIPFGCLVPVNIDGLVLSGRNISGSHIAHSSYRAMPICMAIGEASGAAAAIAVKNDENVRDVDVKQLQKLL